MSFLLAQLRAHGVAVVFLASLAESMGVPIPALPALLLGGALSAEHQLRATPLVLAGAGAMWIGDVVWYALGWIQGRRVLGTLCRLSLNPDACVGRAERSFRRRPGTVVFVAKFLPGMSLMMPPLAGITRMQPLRFLSTDGLASFAWSAAAVALGLLFGARVLPHVLHAQRVLGLLAVGAALAFLAWKFYERRWLVRRYAVERIEIDELQKLLASPAREVLVVDLRNESAFSRSTHMIAGARRIPPGEFDRQIHTLPPDKEIVLYCT